MPPPFTSYTQAAGWVKAADHPISYPETGFWEIARNESPILNGWSLALIGNASGQTAGDGAGSRSEAFSIRRLGGNRWRLRRTRCAMGFERQPGSERSLGRAARGGGNAIRMVGVAVEMSKSACGKVLAR